MIAADIDPDRSSLGRPDRTQDRGKAPTRARVLVVDDDDNARRALEKLLRANGFPTSTASDGEAALAEARRALPGVVLTDIRMPRMDGVELCMHLHEIDSDLPVIMMTATAELQSVVESLRQRAQDFLTKPLDFEEVLWRVERAIERRTAKLEHEEVRRTLTERLVERAETEAQQRAQLNALLANLGEGVAVADSSGRILMVNAPARAILGVGDEVLRSIDDLHVREVCDLEGRRLSSEQRPLMRALRGEMFADYETMRIRPNGERRRIMSTGASVRDADGNVTLAIVVFRDVTELRRLEERRDEYAALVSHDLRNPLGVVLMSTSLLKKEASKRGAGSVPPAIVVETAERIERSAKRMVAMLEELTQAAGLESQGVPLLREACDLRNLVANVVDSLDDAGARRIMIAADDASSCLVLADASQLERVVANLFTNALKYSAEDAPVSVRLAREGSDVVLEVIDRGIGIAPESVKRLFERYYRAPGGKARASGLGLGLYIARLIVEAHGGRIYVTSEVGKGSTFKMILPSHAAA
jgi:PAS domain S-box-containing protein